MKVLELEKEVVEEIKETQRLRAKKNLKEAHIRVLDKARELEYAEECYAEILNQNVEDFSTRNSNVDLYKRATLTIGDN